MSIDARMHLDCPQCRAGIAVEKPDAPDADIRLTCPHCGISLMLDLYAGRLFPVGRGSAADGAAERSATAPTRKRRGIFQPRLSEGRDTLAVVFVVLCLGAIVFGGLRLVLDMRSGPALRPSLDPRSMIARFENLVAGFLTGETSRGEGARRHLARGRHLVQGENFARGLRELDAALAVDPENYEIHFWRGRALVKMNRESEAIAAFEAAIALNPRYSYAHDNLGWIYLRRGDYETSLIHLDRSLALNPENGWAYYNRGRIHFERGQSEKAFQDAEAACRLGFQDACDILKRHNLPRAAE